MIDTNKTNLRFDSVSHENVLSQFTEMVDDGRRHSVLYISQKVSVIFPNNFGDELGEWTWESIEDLIRIIFSAYFQTYSQTYRGRITTIEFCRLLGSLIDIRNSQSQNTPDELR